MYAALQHMTSKASQETMTERRHRLHQELAEAYATPEDNWRGGHIYRLADELRMLNAQSLNHVHATNIREICGQGFDMRRFATVALTAAAALGACCSLFGWTLPPVLYFEGRTT